jgi:hypothetical protein
MTTWQIQSLDFSEERRTILPLLEERAGVRTVVEAISKRGPSGIRSYGTTFMTRLLCDETEEAAAVGQRKDDFVIQIGEIKYGGIR